jgi:predicted anti-sigma-YlaC factor YlaD
MTQEACEAVRLSALAIRDGETPPLPKAQIQAHLRECPDCRREVAEQSDIAGLLAAQKRRSQDEPVWPAIASRLASMAAGPGERANLAWLVLLGCALVIYKAAVLCVGMSLGWSAIKVLPLALAWAVFRGLKANPLQLSSAPRIEGELP